MKCHSLGPPVPHLWPRVDLCSDWGTFGKICAKSRTKHREWLPPSLVEQWGIGASSYGNLHGQWQPLDLWGTLFLDNANTRIIHKLERFTGFEVVSQYYKQHLKCLVSQWDCFYLPSLMIPPLVIHHPMGVVCWIFSETPRKLTPPTDGGRIINSLLLGGHPLGKVVEYPWWLPFLMEVLTCVSTKPETLHAVCGSTFDQLTTQRRSIRSDVLTILHLHADISIEECWWQRHANTKGTHDLV